MRLFDVDPWFFVAHLGHVFILDALGYAILAYYGTSWIPYLTAAVILTISQVSRACIYLGRAGLCDPGILRDQLDPLPYGSCDTYHISGK